MDVGQMINGGNDYPRTFGIRFDRNTRKEGYC